MQSDAAATQGGGGGGGWCGRGAAAAAHPAAAPRPLVPLLDALVRPNDQLEPLALEERLGDVGAELRAGAAPRVGDAPLLLLRVRP